MTYLQNIADTLEAFSAWSGLTMNRSKTELFISWLNQSEAADISTLSFSLGSLPVHYLGFALMHRKLQICDYRPLIDQRKRRFSSWTLRALSYAGKTVLIFCVIYSIINFLFSSFLLPKGCLKWLNHYAQDSFGMDTSQQEQKLRSLGVKSVFLSMKVDLVSGIYAFFCLKLIWLLFCAIWVKANTSKIIRFGAWMKTRLQHGLGKLSSRCGLFLKYSFNVYLGMDIWLDFGLTIGPLLVH